MGPLRALAGAPEPERTAEFFEEVEKILTQYVADKFNLSAYGMTRFDIERQLGETLGAGAALYREIMELYGICDESRFGRGDVPHERKKKALKILREAVGCMEKVR